MRKEIRDEINRANAGKSTGPKTAEGKQRSAMNAFKHGLTGQSLMLQHNEMWATTASPRPCYPTSNPKPSPLAVTNPPLASGSQIHPGVRASQKERIACERAEREADPHGECHENKRDHFDLASFGRNCSRDVPERQSLPRPDSATACRSAPNPQ